MEIDRSKLWTGFMSWAQIVLYKEQIIDMELDEMIQFHYPDRKIPRSYPEQKVTELEQHLANGNTYFWGAIYDGKLLGYRWSFTSMFIDKLRWNSRSCMFLPEARGLGLGTMSIEAEIEKAMEIGCDEVATMYVPQNQHIAHINEKFGFQVTRIEAVRKLNRAPERQDEV